MHSHAEHGNEGGREGQGRGCLACFFVGVGFFGAESDDGLEALDVGVGFAVAAVVADDVATSLFAVALGHFGIVGEVEDSVCEGACVIGFDCDTGVGFFEYAFCLAFNAEDDGALAGHDLEHF